MRPTNLLRAFALTGGLALLGGTAQAQYNDYTGYYGAPAGYAAPENAYQYAQPAADEVEGGAVDPGYFDQQLAAYGQWVDTEAYGRCWIPAQVSAGWRPYTLGHWAWTDYGWTWVSDEPFGWAVYHYGRWAVLPGQGWVWVPGRVWGPAWVAWRTGGGYCGWAPLTPAVGFGVSLSITAGDLGSYVPDSYYTFVPERAVCDPYLHREVVPVERNVTIIHQTTNITNITVVNHRVVNRGMDVNRFERDTGRRVERATIREVNHANELRTTRINTAAHEIPIVRPKGVTRLAATNDVRDRSIVTRDRAEARPDRAASTVRTPAVVTRPAPKVQVPAIQRPPVRTAIPERPLTKPAAQPTVRQPAPAANVPALNTAPKRVEPTTTRRPAVQPTPRTSVPLTAPKRAEPTSTQRPAVQPAPRISTPVTAPKPMERAAATPRIVRNAPNTVSTLPKTPAERPNGRTITSFPAATKPMPAATKPAPAVTRSAPAVTRSAPAATKFVPAATKSAPAAIKPAPAPRNTTKEARQDDNRATGYKAAFGDPSRR